MRRPPTLHPPSTGRSTDRLHRRHEHSREYHTNRWRLASERYRNTSEGCICRRCKELGVITASKAVDHIIPVSQGGSFWDEANWQPLCASCHLAKLSEERTGKPARRRMGCDPKTGMPLDPDHFWNRSDD